MGFYNLGFVRLAWRGFAVKFVCRAAVLAIEISEIGRGADDNLARHKDGIRGANESFPGVHLHCSRIIQSVPP